MKHFILFFLWLGISTINVSAQDIEQTPEVRIVEKFVDLMFETESSDTRNEQRMELISPIYMEAVRKLHPNVQVNSYAPYNYAVDKQEENQVRVFIWGRDKVWAHALTFRVEKIEDAYYIIPEEPYVDDLGYFNPWMKAEEYITLGMPEAED